MCNNSTCYQCNQPPLCAPNDCSCPVKDLSTDCVLYTGNDLSCSGIPSQTILTELIQQLDEFICTLVEQSLGALSLINIGTGVDVYKGLDLQGRKEIKRINAVGDLVTVTSPPTANDISISIDENELSNFILDTVDIENVGSGTPVYKGFDPGTSKYQFKTIKSESLSITENLASTEISIELAESGQIPGFYVNNLYIPTYSEWVNAGGNLISNPTFQYKGKGSLAKPFTDSIRYTSAIASVITPNTSIQNALDFYVGDTGTYSKANPEKGGQRITIQNNNSYYTFTGDFTYNRIKILIEGNVAATTTDWILDMDHPTIFPSDSEGTEIKLSEAAVLELTVSKGFRNSGNTSSAPPAYDSGKICYLLGDGTIYSSYNGINKLTQYLINSDGNINDSNLHFQIKCRLQAEFQGIYFCKKYCKIDFYNTLQSSRFLGSVDITLQAFKMTGGQIRFYEKGSISIGGETSGRNYGVTFSPTATESCTFLLGSAKVNYDCNYVFAKLTNYTVNFSAVGSRGGGATVVPGGSTVVYGLFENTGATPWGVSFRDCSYEYTGIDFTKVDLTLGNNVSSTNTIGNSVVETLVVYNNRVNAIAAGVPLYSAFLNRDNVGFAEGSEANPYPGTSKWYRDIVLPA
jgi:hypothetical protein